MTTYSGTPNAPLRQTIFWTGIMISIVMLLFYLKWVALWHWRDAAFYAYSVLVTGYVLLRFGLAGLYKQPKKNKYYLPSVSVVIPAFNEEAEIEHTVKSWLKCDYPSDKYQVIVIDDGSRDKTLENLKKIKHPNLIVDNLPQNQGKKHAQMKGFSHATAEIIVLADSDSYPQNPNAIREIVQPFQSNEIGGVCGHTDVANTDTWLGKMQRLRYWSAFDRYKRSESITGSVICLSGCFSGVRHSALDKVKDEWFSQTFLGQRASYGDDRALTTLLLKHGYNTVYAPDAKAKTIVPSTWKKFWRQQMRWEKSYIRETLIGFKFMWRRPLAAFEYYIGAFVTWAGFVVAAYTIWFRPIFTHGTFLPWFYLVGLIIVSFLYAANYRRYNKDHLWIYAPVWSIVYAAVLIWRFPLALLDLRKSDWKTR